MSKSKKRSRKKAQKKREKQKRARKEYEKNRRFSQKLKKKVWKKCQPLIKKAPYLLIWFAIKKLAKYFNLLKMRRRVCRKRRAFHNSGGQAFTVRHTNRSDLG